jgi:hypothetical protein
MSARDEEFRRVWAQWLAEDAEPLPDNLPSSDGLFADAAILELARDPGFVEQARQRILAYVARRDAEAARERETTAAPRLALLDEWTKRGGGA